MSGATYADLAGRSVFVSGGATGIGRDIVTAFVAQEAAVTFVDIDEESGAALAGELGDAARFIVADVTDDGALSAAIGTAEERGGLHTLVNNAANDVRHDVDTVDAEAWDRSVAVNLRHQFVASQAAARVMAPRSTGSIVNFGSVAPTMKIPDLAIYSTCKAAVRGLTRSLAREYGPHGIRVNTIIPGAILTPKQVELWYTDEAAVQELLDQQCLKRRLDGTDIANMVLFLASDVSSGCTGQEFVVDAGII